MKQITIAEAIQRTVEHREVFHDEMLHVMRQIMRGELSPAQIAGFIVGLRVKKETIGEIAAAAQVMHGKTSRIRHDGLGVFSRIEDDFTATRYHSLVVERQSLPADLSITAEAEDGAIMGLRHRRLPVEGVQFHPEALLTEHGHKMLQNFIAGGRP